WKSRRLSTREMCRLQTMPDGYAVPGNLRTAQRLLGNAVTSALAEILGLEIRRQLLRENAVPEGATLVPQRSPGSPPAEAAVAVPRRYRHIVGQHAAHPGTGLGPAARGRAARKRESLRSRTHRMK